MVVYRQFSFDKERRLILAADGTRLHLTAKAFDLLDILIDEAPRVVRKTEIHQRLWPETFVTDAALTCLVKELRRVLPRGGESPAIRTAHGIGYAFDVERLTDDAPIAGLHWLVSRFRRYALRDGVNVIGREQQCEIWLDAADVSRRHARVIVEGDRVAIEDLGSKNGTVVQGRQAVRPIELEDGNSIRAGGVELTYRRQSKAGSTATAAR
jgi:DNA-binding winged helix-turn-helix (wHTH) protein